MELRSKLNEVVDLVASGASHDDVRNRLRQLTEGVSRGSALSVASIERRVSLAASRSTWAEAYALNEREIRASLSGDIGKLTESLPKKRFRVLGTEYAPEDAHRYLPDLVRSANAVLEHYTSIRDRADAASSALSAAPRSSFSLEEDALLNSVKSFVESLSDSADFLSREFRAIIEASEPEGLAHFARTHDILAEGLEDFTLALSFAERTITPLLGERP